MRAIIVLGIMAVFMTGCASNRAFNSRASYGEAVAASAGTMLFNPCKGMKMLAMTAMKAAGVESEAERKNARDWARIEGMRSEAAKMRADRDRQIEQMTAEMEKSRLLGVKELQKAQNRQNSLKNRSGDMDRLANSSVEKVLEAVQNDLDNISL